MLLRERAEDILSPVDKTLEEFKSLDDLTMLCIEYNGDTEA